MLQNCKNHNKIKNDEAVIKDYGNPNEVCTLIKKEIENDELC